MVKEIDFLLSRPTDCRMMSILTWCFAISENTLNAVPGATAGKFDLAKRAKAPEKANPSYHPGRCARRPIRCSMYI